MAYFILHKSLQKQISKTTLVPSNRTSIDRSTSFLQRTASTASAGRPERRSSRPEGNSRNQNLVKTPREKPEGAEEKSPLICEITRTKKPVAPPRRKKPVPGKVTQKLPWKTP